VGEKGGSGRSGPFGRCARKSSGAGASRNAVVVLVDIPRLGRTRESWGFSIKTRSSPTAWDHERFLFPPMDGRRTPSGDALPVHGRGSPSRMEPPPARAP
jgi:hypothetical protein